VFSGKGALELLTPPLKLVSELYVTNVIVRHAKTGELYTAQVGASFHVRHQSLNTHFGVFHESALWRWGGNGAAPHWTFEEIKEQKTRD
jgi:lipopolysaccharide transport system ATP-binding protein